VQPALYGGPPHAEGTPEDAKRDAVTLPLIRAAVASGVPVLAICRGMQELNVALGGTLHQRLQDLPDRIDHSTPMHPTPECAPASRTASASPLEVAAPRRRRARYPGELAAHQGMDRLAPTLVAEGVAPDGTVEAVRASTPRLVIGVQWHPEYDWETDAVLPRHLRGLRQSRCQPAPGPCTRRRN